MGPIDADSTKVCPHTPCIGDRYLYSLGSFLGGPPDSMKWFSRVFYSYHDNFLTLGFFSGKDHITMYNSLMALGLPIPVNNVSISGLFDLGAYWSFTHIHFILLHNKSTIYFYFYLFDCSTGTMCKSNFVTSGLSCHRGRIH